jgi:outer membrane protein
MTPTTARPCLPTLRHTAVLALAALPWLAHAQSQGEPVNVVKLGAIQYQPHARTTGISGLGVPAGADATVGSATTALFTYERMVAPMLGIEAVLGVPPTIKAQAAGTVPFLGEVLSARNVAPTVLINLHLGTPGGTLQPYLGIGINYTRFEGARSPYGWQIKLSDSWGLAGQAGLDWRINRQWGAFASVGMAQVKSDLVAVGASVLRTTIDFRPITYAAGLAYHF